MRWFQGTNDWDTNLLMHGVLHNHMQDLIIRGDSMSGVLDYEMGVIGNIT